ncbi:MAG: putative DNA mismatch repair protein Msh3 [Streblomastix strix]|uniref:Putative DNA mismatch repair protein Msh3 n=1 Tax=Streblomastix strix TaxID=222440 RepID=A0A5J4WSH1_9EUKA|nr:MAG: putative DNA mismatch repair protein Msh3 [Streblomastix strix]
MEEASEILKKASKRSLIVLDEIGRGTATHDGTAIAYATLAYIINRIKCLCLFVTHYPSLAYIDEDNDVNELNDNKQQLQQKIKVVQPFHMNYTHLPSDPTHIVFLYTLVPGLAEKSFGLNVARLAGIPSQIIQRASQKSAQFESIMNQSKDKQKEKDNEELKK